MIDKTIKIHKSNLRFVTETLHRENINTDTGEVKNEYRVVIKLVNTINGRSRVHRYTSFINLWLDSKLATPQARAKEIVAFLNYITFETDINGLQTLSNLTIDHGVMFLEHLSEKTNSRQTVLKHDSTLTHFYYFLTKRSLLNHITKRDFVVKNNRGPKSIESLFRGRYVLPEKNKKKLIHQLELELTFEFLYTAFHESNQIALGVYFQFFGGLRVSEVLNLTYDDLNEVGPFGRNGIVAHIKDNNLRPEQKKHTPTSPKKEREQVIFGVGDLLESMYIDHQQSYQLPTTRAVFINRDGKPMSKGSYYSFFNKAKDRFLQRLKDSGDVDYMLASSFLMEKEWATHIGRGIFSHMIAKEAKNATEIAVLRGDARLDSALQYLSDSKRLESMLLKSLSRMYTDSSIKQLNHY